MDARTYLRSIGTQEFEPRTVAFDPGYDLSTVEGHFAQSGRYIAGYKISMSTWQLVDEEIIRRKIAVARDAGAYVVTGGGPFEIATACGKLQDYIDLCAAYGVQRIEAGRGIIADAELNPAQIVAMCDRRGLEVQFELGEKLSGTFTPEEVDALLEEGKLWLSAGAKQLVVEAREDAKDIGLFTSNGDFKNELGRSFMQAFGEHKVVFEAPNKKSQFALIDEFGGGVYLGNIRLEEILRVEIYRRGLHADSFLSDALRPKGARI